MIDHDVLSRLGPLAWPSGFIQGAGKWKVPNMNIKWRKDKTSMFMCVPSVTNTNSYSASHDNWCTATLWNRIMTAQCEGMGKVGSARYEPALLPPCPSIRVLSYSNSRDPLTPADGPGSVSVKLWSLYQSRAQSRDRSWLVLVLLSHRLAIPGAAVTFFSLVNRQVPREN